MTTDGAVTLGRRLDLHHDAVQEGPIATCSVCHVSTEDGFVTGLRHNPQPDELATANGFLHVFARTGDASDCA